MRGWTIAGLRAELADLDEHVHAQPQFDQALAALRDQVDNIERFMATPPWRPLLTWRRYQEMRRCSARLRAAMSELYERGYTDAPPPGAL